MDSTLIGSLAERAFGTLEILAHKLGVGINELWPVLVTRQIVIGILEICLFPLSLILLPIVLKWKPNENHFSLKSNAYWARWLAIFITCLIISGMLLIALFDGVVRVTTPEYFALRSIFQLVK